MDAGLKVIFPLHDALYIEYPSDKLGYVDTFARCMREAFTYYFDDKEGADLIRLDANAWSPDYSDNTFSTPMGVDGKMKMQKIDIDERSVKEYEKFKKYMEA